MTGKRKRHKGPQPYSVLTINGRIRLHRVRWHCKKEGSETLTDHLLDVMEQTISEGVREMACRLNQSASSFVKAAANLYRTAHIKISKDGLRDLVIAEGEKVQRAMQQARISPSWSSADCTVEPHVPQQSASTTTPEVPPVAQRVTRMYAGCDGVKVRIITDEEKKLRRKNVRAKRRRRGRKCRPLPSIKPGADCSYKEFRVGYLYDQSKQHRYVGVTRGNHEAAGRMLKRMGDQVQLSKADERIALIDGAPWIRNQLELHGLVEAIGLDFYHLQDYAQKTRRAVFGVAGKSDKTNAPSTPNQSQPDPGKAWVQELMHTYKHDGYQAAWARLVAWRETLPPSQRAAVDPLLQYVAERRELIRYPAFQEQGWDIGSGPTESECKTTTHRVKGNSRRWGHSNAESMMALSALEDSCLWNQHWQTLDPETN